MVDVFRPAQQVQTRQQLALALNVIDARIRASRADELESMLRGRS